MAAPEEDRLRRLEERLAALDGRLRTLVDRLEPLIQFAEKRLGQWPFGTRR